MTQVSAQPSLPSSPVREPDDHWITILYDRYKVLYGEPTESS